MVITVIGIPFGIYFYIAWQFVQQEILFEDRSIRGALARQPRTGPWPLVAHDRWSPASSR